MKLLCIHTKDLRIEAGVSGRNNRARKGNERKLRERFRDSLPPLDFSNKTTMSENALLTVVSVEKGDEEIDLESVRDRILRTRSEAGIKEVVITSGELSDHPEDPLVASEIMHNLVGITSSLYGSTKYAPFGWEKSLKMDVPMHPHNMLWESFEVESPWDRIADEFDDYMFDTNHYRAQYMLLSTLDKYVREPVLDLCCGSGRVLHYLYDRGKGVPKYTGIDYSKQMIRLTRKMNSVFQVPYPKDSRNANVQLLCERAEKIPSMLAGLEFKTICMFNSTAYIELAGVLETLPGIMAPDARLIVADEDPFTFGECVKLVRQRIEDVSVRVPIEELKKRIESSFSFIEQHTVPIDEKHGLRGMVFGVPEGRVLRFEGSE